MRFRLHLACILAAVPSLAGCERQTALVVATTTDISTLDPFAMFSRMETGVADHVLETLTFRDRDMAIVPMLATSWERLEGDLSWQFHLREGVLFHNGEPFDAQAVRYSIAEANRRNREGMTLGGATVAVPAAEITSVDIPDAHTVVIATSSPKALLPFYLSQIPILAPGFYEQAPDAVRAETMVGTGPYTVVERVRDSHMTLGRHAGYWGPLPAIERVTFRVIPEISTQIAELETGGVHIVPALPLDQAQVLLDAPGIEVQTIEGGRRMMIGITTAGGPAPLADKRVRQALNHAIDFDAINEGFFLGRARRMSHVFNPPFENSGVEAYGYDPDRARALLSEAGYPDGFTLGSLDTPIGKWIQDYEMAQVIAAQLEAVGVRLEEGVRSYEWGNYRQKLLGYDLPGLFMQASGGEFELSLEAADLTITSPSNFYRWEYPPYEALWQELQGELDIERRHAIGIEMQDIVRDEAPWIFLLIQPDTYGVSDAVDWRPRVDELIHVWDVDWTGL